MQLNQHDFGIAARALTRELKARLEKGELPVFHPDRIEIISAKMVNVGRLDPPAPNLRVCLCKFGATLFHLLAGESEFNHEKYEADPKENYEAVKLEEPASAIIRHLLSGAATSFPNVEKMINGAYVPSIGKAFGKLITKVSEKALVGGEAIRNAFLGIILACGKLLCLLFSPFSFIKRYLSNIARKWKMADENDLEKMYFFIQIPIWIILLPFIVLNWSYSHPIIVMTPMFYVVLWLFVLMASGLRPGKKSILFIVCLMIPLAPLSFTSFSGDASKNKILVERTTGEFHARLKYAKDENTALLLDGFWINHFRYRVEDGLPLEWLFAKDGVVKLANKDKQSAELKLPFTSGFAFTEREKYDEAWKKYGQGEELIWPDINAPLQGLNHVLNKRFVELIAGQNPKIRPWLFNPRRQKIEDAEKTVATAETSAPQIIVVADTSLKNATDEKALLALVAKANAAYAESRRQERIKEISRSNGSISEHAFTINHSAVKEIEKQILAALTALYKSEVKKRYANTWFVPTFDDEVPTTD